MLSDRAVWRRSTLAAWVVCFVATAAVPLRPSRADSVTLLGSDQLAARACFELVQLAQRELDLAYFSIGDDAFSGEFLARLADAARRGVRVRIVVDGLNNHIPPGGQDMLLESGVQLREYHRPRLGRAWSLTQRLHDKFLCRDRSEMILGSRNIAAAHFGLEPCDADNYLDLDLRIDGTAVGAACHYFNQLWGSRQLDQVAYDALARRAGRQLRKLFRPEPAADRAAVAVRLPPAAGPPAIEWETLDIAPDCVQLLYDPAGQKDRPGGVHAELCRLLDSAERSIVIESPYVVLEGDCGRALQAALARNVQVSILTNSLASTNHVIVFPAYRDSIRKYQKLGAEVWEYTGPRILHVKAVVVDGSVAGVMSFNFDPRSAYLDTQTGILVRDPRLAAQLLCAMQVHFAAAVPLHTMQGPTVSRHPVLQDPWRRDGKANIGPVRMQALRLLSHGLVRQL